MKSEQNFDDIRPFNNDEFKAVLNKLINDPKFQPILENIYQTPENIDAIKSQLTHIDNRYHFQRKIIYPIAQQIITNSTNGVYCSGLENIQKDESYLFISNHRDIILDSAFLNVLMFDQGLNTTEIAIGSNLLIFDWITNIVRLNGAFLVKRNIPVKQMLKTSKKLSAYIRHTINEKNESVWIAQREGRTKDGNDQTQIALLKMLNMSNQGSFSEGFKELKLVPLSISYEIEPCGNEKVAELLARQKDPDFQKTAKDDLMAMAGGLKNDKGGVNFAFGNPIDLQLDKIGETGNTNEKLAKLAAHIDLRIHKNYKLWPNNYIAYDLLNGSEKYAAHYTHEEKEAFTALTENRLELLGEEKEEAKPLWLKMYATPVDNHDLT